MSLLQAIVAASASGTVEPPNYYLGLSGTYSEGQTLSLYLDYTNATGSTLYWSIISDSAIEGADYTTSSGNYSGTTAPSGTGSATLEYINYIADSSTEGTQYFIIRLGTSPGGSDLISTGININDTSTGGPMTGGDGSAGSGQWNGITYTLTPSTNGSGTPGTANPGDVVTWSITSNPDDTSGRTMHWWVDNNAVPSNTWVENTNNGTVTLDGSGNASFSLTVVSSVPTHALFRMYVGMSLYNGFVTHGYIGV